MLLLFFTRLYVYSASAVKTGQKKHKLLFSKNDLLSMKSVVRKVRNALKFQSPYLNLQHSSSN